MAAALPVPATEPPAKRPRAQALIADSTTRVLILTTLDLDEYVYAALRAGASGFLLKDAATPSRETAPDRYPAAEAVRAAMSERKHEGMPLRLDLPCRPRPDERHGVAVLPTP